MSVGSLPYSSDAGRDVVILFQYPETGFQVIKQVPARAAEKQNKTLE